MCQVHVSVWFSNFSALRPVSEEKDLSNTKVVGSIPASCGVCVLSCTASFYIRDVSDVAVGLRGSFFVLFCFCGTAIKLATHPRCKTAFDPRAAGMDSKGKAGHRN